MPILPSIPREERRFFRVAMLIIILSLVIPPLIGVVRSVTGPATLIGLSTQALSDSEVYYSMMEQARTSGHTFMVNAFTPEAQAPSLFSPLWALLGLLAGVLHAPNPLIFHLARLAMVALFCWTAYRVLILLNTSRRQRKFAFGFLVLAGGIGPYVAPFVRILSDSDFLRFYPVDLWVSEGFTYLTFLHSPLFIGSQLLLLAAFAFALINARTPGRVPTHIFAAIAVILATIHTYDLITLFVILAAFSVVRVIRDPLFTPALLKQDIRRLVWMGLSALPIVITMLVGFAIEPAMGGWAKQNITLSPPIWGYLIGYGFLLVLAGWGWAVLRRQRDTTSLLLMTWGLTQALLLYFPVQFQRRFTNAFHIILAILASFAVERFFAWTNRQAKQRRFLWRVAAAWSLPLVLCVSTLYAFGHDVRDYWTTDKPESGYLYISDGTAAAMAWLRDQPPGITTGSIYTNYLLTGRTLRTPYVAHGHQTVQYHGKRDVLNGALESGDGARVATFLREANIRYVLWTPREIERYPKYAPASADYLRKVYDNGVAQVFEIIPPTS